MVNSPARKRKRQDDSSAAASPLSSHRNIPSTLEIINSQIDVLVSGLIVRSVKMKKVSSKGIVGTAPPTIRIRTQATG